MSNKATGRPQKLELPARMEVIVESKQRNAIDILAKRRNCSRNDVVREALNAYLQGEE